MVPIVFMSTAASAWAGGLHSAQLCSARLSEWDVNVGDVQEPQIPATLKLGNRALYIVKF